jgi:hypothetical protein
MMAKNVSIFARESFVNIIEWEEKSYLYILRKRKNWIFIRFIKNFRLMIIFNMNIFLSWINLSNGLY